jgi:hypothetical protein
MWCCWISPDHNSVFNPEVAALRISGPQSLQSRGAVSIRLMARLPSKD